MSEGTYKLVQLASGAWSLHSTKYRETFHPVIGPAAEAEALYLKQVKLVERLAQHTGEFVVWDIGLGAAANVLTILRAAREISATLRIVSFDYTLEPLQFAFNERAKLGYIEEFIKPVEDFVQNRQSTFQSGNCNVYWSLQLGDFPSFLKTKGATKLPKPHLILFDAFSPAKNPAMWTLPLFRDLFALLDPGRPCVMPTYSRSTMLRVTLLLAGFFVGVGHATGEKEETTIAANSMTLLEELLKPEWLERVRRSRSAEPMIEPVYRQSGLTESTWSALTQHPQFRLQI